MKKTTKKEKGEQITTDEKKAGRENDSKFTELFEHLSQGVFFQNADGRITEINQAALRMMGLSREQCLGRTSFDPGWKVVDEQMSEIPPAEHPSMVALKTGKPVHDFFLGLFNPLTRDINWLIVNAIPRFRQDEQEAFEVFVSMHDITDRFRMENESSKQDHLLNRIFDVLPVAVWLTDPAGRVIRGNAEGLKIWGKDLTFPFDRFEEFRAMRLPDKITVEADDWAVLHTLRDRSTIEEVLEIRSFDEKIKIITNFTTPLEDEDGNLLGAIIVNKDLTDLYRALDQQRKQYDLLKIAGETALFGGWSVDLRTNICTWSDEVARIHEEEPGFSPLVEQGINYYAPEYRESITDIFTKCASEGIPYDEVMQIITARGQKRWVRTIGKPETNEQGKIVKVYGSFQDVTRVKSAEEELSMLDKQLKFHVENSPLAVIEWDHEFRIRKWSQEAENIFGWTETEVLGKKPGDFNIVHEDDVPLTAELIDELLSGREVKNISNNRNYTKDGEIKHCRWFNSAMVNSKGELLSVLSLVHDVSEEIRIGERMRAADRIFNHSLEMMCIAGFDGYIKTLNPAWTRTLGWSREELMERPFIEFIHPDDRDHALSAGEFMSQGKEINRFENRYRCKDGSYKWLLWNSYNYPDEEIIFGVAHDITESRAMMQELRESEEKYKTLIEISPDAVFINFKNTVIYLNPFAVKLFGARVAEDIIGKKPFDLFHPDYHDAIRERIIRMSEEGISSPLLEEKILRLNGEIVDVEVTATLFPYKGETAILVILRDITERKKSENQLRELTSKLEVKVREKTAELNERITELERFREATINRELRMKELRDEIKLLKDQLKQK